MQVEKVRQGLGVGSYFPDCTVYILPLQENTLGVKITDYCRSLLTARYDSWKPVGTGKPAPVTGIAGVNEVFSSWEIG